MAVNSKKKGDGFERKIAKLLSEWWNESFERVPASGGLHWKNDQRVYGDIIPPEGSNFPFTVECKNRESWNMDSLFSGSKEIQLWWDQVSGDCEESGKKPMLIFTRNRRPDYVMIRTEDTTHYHHERDHIQISFFDGENFESVTVMGLVDFLIHTPPNPSLS